MIDTDKYEGHTPAPWEASHDVLEYGHVVNNDAWRVYVGEHEKRAEIENHTFDHDDLSEADARLIADAPLLLDRLAKAEQLIHELTGEPTPESKEYYYWDGDEYRFHYVSIDEVNQ